MNRSGCAPLVLLSLVLASSCDCGGAATGDGGPAGSDGRNGGDGTDGESGRDGTDGIDGTDGLDGIDGVPGENASELLIIRLDADDAAGSGGDVGLTTTFAADVSLLEERLTGASLTLRYARRSAPELLDGAPGVACGNDNACLRQRGSARVLDLDLDVAESGFLDVGARFHLAFDQPMAEDTRDRLSAWINGALGIPNAIAVSRSEFGDPFASAFGFEALVDVPITSFTSTGNNVGVQIALPAFTVQDAFGDGNASAMLTITDDAGTGAQGEPAGLPFDPALDNLTNAVPEDGRYAVGDSFRLAFDREMDQFSTQAAIKTRLESGGPFSRVDVATMNGSFVVTVLDDDANLNASGGRHTLVLDPWDVTSAWGITNSNAAIEFVITDITVPFVTTRGSSSTLAILLATSVPSRASDVEVVEGDTLSVVFSEPMDATLVREDLLRLLQAAGLSATLVDVIGGGASYSYTLKASDSLTVSGAELDLGLLDSSAIDDANGTALQTQQRLHAVRTDWMTPPALVDQDPGGDLATLTIALGSATLENRALEAGDTLGVMFDKSMDVATTLPALAAALATQAPTGATRGGTWDAATVETAIAVSSTLTTNDTFRYTLTGTQTLTPTADAVDLGPLGSGVLDINGLRLPAAARLVAPRDAFDPRATPSLVSVRSARSFASPCGDARLEGNDQLHFTFSEAIDPTVAPSLAGEIAAKIDAQASGSAVQLGHVDASGNPLFVVTLPDGASLPTNAALSLVLDRTQIVDVNGVVAIDDVAATGRLEAGDFLTLQGGIARDAIAHDGELSGGDSFELTFGCVMDDFETLSSVQEAVDTLAGDGTARVTTLDNVHYTVTILPGRSLDVSVPRTLEIFGVATDENLGDVDNAPTPVAGPLRITLLDGVVGDAVLTYEPGSAAGDQARFVANSPLTSGTWVLDAVSQGLSRAEVELALVFSSWVPPVGPVCGNYVLEDGEACDPPTSGVCNDSCLVVPASCGDGFVQEGEHCDPPNAEGCGSDCLYPGVPAAWICPPTWFGGNDGCDCGCGAVDADCADASAASCSFCFCQAPGCDDVDNSQCAP